MILSNSEPLDWSMPACPYVRAPPRKSLIRLESTSAYSTSLLAMENDEVRLVSACPTSSAFSIFLDLSHDRHVLRAAEPTDNFSSHLPATA